MIPRLAIDLIKKWEGFREAVYLDAASVPTIGYGSTKFPPGLKLVTEPQAEKMLIEHIEREILPVMDREINAPINEHQTAALISFIYNVGTGAFKRSTLLRRLNKGDYEGASHEFLRWNKAGNVKLPGLVRRREAERQLFLTKGNHNVAENKGFFQGSTH